MKNKSAIVSSNNTFILNLVQTYHIFISIVNIITQGKGPKFSCVLMYLLVLGILDRISRLAVSDDILKAIKLLAILFS
jgi:hypothetical protein